MWLTSPIRDFIAAELLHMHRPEIADLVLAADFTIRGRILFVDPAPLIRAGMQSQSNRAFLEKWICLAAMRAGLPIDTAAIFPFEEHRPWQVSYLVGYRLKNATAV